MTPWSRSNPQKHVLGDDYDTGSNPAPDETVAAWGRLAAETVSMDRLRRGR